MEIIIIASHGTLATGMKETIKLISGLDDNIFAFNMLEGENPDLLFSKVKEVVSEMGNDNSFVMFSDLLGGSVNTVLTNLLINSNFHLISSMNLPVILDFVLSSGDDIDTRIDNSIENAKDSLRKVVLTNYVEEDIWED